MPILECIIAGIIGAVAVGATALVVKGIITYRKIREKMRSRGISTAIVTAVDQCSNTVTLEDLMSNKRLEIQGDGIDYDIEYNNVIRA